MIKGKKVLITGAGGFIGSHLTETLVTAGARTTALLHYNAKRDIGNLTYLDQRALSHVELVFGDISDPEMIGRLVEGCDYIFHLAALIAIPYSYTAPRSYVKVNVEGTLNILEAARRGEVGRVVHTSTSEVYGSAVYVPIDERHPLQGQSPYSASKIGADKMAEAYARSFEVPVVTVRPFNTYGPRQSLRAFIPTVINQALADGDIRLGSVSPIRDLTYATDTAAGFIAAALADGVDGRTFNLGTSTGPSVGEVARLILQIMGVDRQIVVDEERIRPKNSEVDRLISNNEAMRTATGWKPEVDLREGLTRTIEFFRANRQTADAHTYVV